MRHLLQQTSGLSDGAGGPLLASAADGTALEAVAELDGAELLHAPGQTRLYANANYVLAALVVERASGMTYPDYVQRRILGPLRMSRSFGSLDAARAAGVSRGHRFWLGVPVASGRSTVPGAGGGIPDLHGRGPGPLPDDVPPGRRQRGRDPRALRGGTQDHARARSRAHLGPWADGRTSRYAMGWLVGGPWAQDGVFHPGSSPDSSAMITLFPGRGLAVATLVGAGHELPVPGNPAVTDRISRNVVHAALGEPVPEGPSLRGFYLAFDLVAFLMVGAASGDCSEPWWRCADDRGRRVRCAGSGSC